MPFRGGHAAKVFEVPRHGVVMIRTHRAPESSAAREVAGVIFLGDEVFDMIQHRLRAAGQ
jgi:hypothetical protein